MSSASDRRKRRKEEAERKLSKKLLKIAYDKGKKNFHKRDYPEALDEEEEYQDYGMDYDESEYGNYHGGVRFCNIFCI